MQNTTNLWLVAGGVLCVMELFLPTQFIILLMGLSALIVGLLSTWVESFALQIVLWLLLSLLGVWLIKRFYTPPRQTLTGGDDIEAETLTGIAPGQTGRVLYEGNSWRAKAVDGTQEIAPQEKVYVVRREGNTLIVASEKMFKN